MDSTRTRRVLIVDAMINLILGIILLFFPLKVMGFLGLPVDVNVFYPSILGAVLIGIGMALLVEVFRRTATTAGLGLEGAMAINICGGIVLTGWLLSGKLSIPLRGEVLLWGLVIVLVGISGAEFLICREKS